MADAGESTVSEATKRRNGLVFLICTSLTYFIAPVTYVGVLHAAILDSLKASNSVANLPESVYNWATPLPVLIAWFWHSPRILRPMLASSQLAIGAAGALVAVLFAIAPQSWWIPALILHPAVIAVAAGVQEMCLWELIGRGMSPEERTRLLGWTFGVGPLFAVLGSCLSQLALKGDFLGVLQMTPLPQPWSYVVLFGVTCPVAWLSAALTIFVQVPPTVETDSGTRLADIKQGLRAFFLNPLIMATACAFLLTYGGRMILNNVTLYTGEVLGEAPEKYAGLQMALRFGCKCAAGFALSWMVARTNAKTSLLTTTSICLAGVTWALLVPGKWYLLSFGLLGAGELFYVYYLNYIVGCSRPHEIRLNSAYTSLITVIIGALPWMFGVVSDRYGLPFSFMLSIGLLTAALAVVQWGLPRNPRLS